MSHALSDWKTITVFLDDTAAGEAIADHAARLAHRCGAHLIGIHALPDYAAEHPASSFALGPQAVNEVIAEQETDERAESLAVRRRLESIAHRHGISGEMRIIRGAHTDQDLIAAARCCDLIVLDYPNPPGLPRNWPADRLLMESGGPMLIFPAARKITEFGRKILIAWNGSREARRAVRDALPFLCTAQSVTVLVVDPETTEHTFRESPGTDLARYLARHGAHADIAHLKSRGAPVGETILSSIGAHNADLVVLGAYSHPRLAEQIFGGTTRTLLARAPAPLFVSV